MQKTITNTQSSTCTAEKPRQPKLWNVVLLDDQDHSYEYVIEMAQRVFSHPVEKAFTLAKTVDADGRAICMTTHREHAELKIEQVHHFGADPRIADCRGAMSAILEPADLGGDDNND